MACKPDAIVVDLYQSIGRNPVTRQSCASGEDEACLSVILPSSRFWHKTRLRCLLADELLMINGYPLGELSCDAVKQASGFLKTDLAGNMFNGASYLLVLMCTLANLPLTDAPPPTDNEELVSAALDALANL